MLRVAITCSQHRQKLTQNLRGGRRIRKFPHQQILESLSLIMRDTRDNGKAELAGRGSNRIRSELFRDVTGSHQQRL